MDSNASLAGLDAAEAAGLDPIRLNTVVVNGQNEADLPDLVRFAGHRGWDIRFIELMPMGPLASVWHDRYVPEARMRAILDPIVEHWQPIVQHHDAAPPVLCHARRRRHRYRWLHHAHEL